MIRVLVVDDQTLVRTGFRTVLDLEDDIDVIGEAADGDEALARTRALRPDVVVMDIRMPRTNGIEATRQITADPGLAGVKVLILTTFEMDEYVFDALDAGASGFLLKHASADELINAVRTIATGEALLSAHQVQRLVAAFASRNRAAGAGPGVAALTDREREAVRLVAAGSTNEQIAQRWVVSAGTVRTHLSRAMTKLHARDRAQLVVIAYRTGLAEPPG
ncbi:response regulator [Gordonia amarae]|uniref:Response regulator n=2 Tax=Gordonia amarae TaxID=36821 RepID=A0A857M9H7_9ACTN|nr:response regulator transcription factor [Gordonia amarae]MCS3877490.1 DNA-binding NarL/FixJ family response regulator [Gordonia amarae]QHN16226.1 response regulator [Gordonia amarae]QHN20795.1 response regulator [Gordonia amarae]QHN29646.1 response regulator [Gordonia amarae]QHN38422.1 response regulator [Gordonia amarae]